MRTKIILFNKPIWVTDGTINDIRDVIELYGYKAPSSANEYIENEFLNYLCGVSMWQSAGNDVMKDFWLDYSTMRIYRTNDNFIKEYMKKARKQMQVSFDIYTTNKRLYEKTEGMHGTIITSHKLSEEIKNKGIPVKMKGCPKR